jgi:two-component system response regulator AtoC
VAATNRDLESQVRQGQFREDLYFRLNVVTLVTVPLRERPEDVQLLANHFLQHFAEENQVVVEGFDDLAIERLLHHTWPGNVRELSNAIERAVVMSTGRIILAEDLPERIGTQDPLAATPSPAETLTDTDQGLRPLVNRYEARVIAESLERNGGNRVRTAQALGISRRSLLYKLQDYGID